MERTNGTPDRLVNQNYLMEITGWKRTTCWRKIQAKFVPPAFYVGSTKPCWKKSDLDAWIAGLGEQLTADDREV